MITPEQEEWLAHLNDTDSVKIYSASPQVKEIFEKIKKDLQQVLGENVNILHRGATSLGISGPGEIDVFIPVLPENYDSMINTVANIFGRPRSNYPLKRARFVVYINSSKAEIIVINEKSKDWENSSQFQAYLEEYPEALKAYEGIKEEAEGLSTQKYYRRKIEFINSILEKI